MTYIRDDKNGPAWGHDRAVQPLEVSRSGGDGAVHQWHVKPTSDG
jgi:hypothetical protein